MEDTTVLISLGGHRWPHMGLSLLFHPFFLLVVVLLSYSLWRAEEFLEEGETCRALSMGLKLSRLNEVELWLVENFMGKRKY